MNQKWAVMGISVFLLLINPMNTTLGQEYDYTYDQNDVGVKEGDEFTFILLDFYLIEEFEEEGAETVIREETKMEIANNIELQAGDEVLVRIIDTTIQTNDIEVEFESGGNSTHYAVDLRYDLFFRYTNWTEYLDLYYDSKDNLDSDIEDGDRYDVKISKFELIDTTTEIGIKQQLDITINDEENFDHEFRVIGDIEERYDRDTGVLLKIFSEYRYENFPFGEATNREYKLHMVRKGYGDTADFLAVQPIFVILGLGLMVYGKRARSRIFKHYTN